MNAHQRQLAAVLMDWLVDMKSKVHYAEVRPMKTAKLATIHDLRRALNSKAGITMDCSESVTLLCRLIGLNDPNGVKYDGTGYTGTLLEHLHVYTNPASARIGALCVVGPGSGDHVYMVRHPGDDPVCFSHGREAGPEFVRLSSDSRQPHRFLNVSKL